MMKSAIVASAGDAFRAALLAAGIAVSLPCGAQMVPPPVPVPGSPPIGHNPASDNQTISRKGKQKKDKKSKDELPTIEFEGTTLANNGKQMVVHTADGRWITMSIDTDTKFTQADAPIDVTKVLPSSTVKVQASIDGEANLIALTVDQTKAAAAPAQKPDPGESSAHATNAPGQAKPSQEDASQADDEELSESKKPLDVPDAPDRPKLTRAHSIASGIAHDGTSSDTSDSEAPNTKQTASTAKPAAKAKPAADEQEDFTIGTDTPIRAASRGGPGAEVLQRSMSWAENFNAGLPNYLCREIITRYVQETKDGDWNPQDVVTANIVMQNGREEQRDVMVGNKKVADISKTGGTWSTGEFASMLHSLFQPTRDTEFKFDRPGVIHDIPTAEFDFGVALLNSDWSIIVGGQTLRPRYTGTLWIEKNTGIVRRLEQEARNIPKDFPMDEIQAAIEYEEVSLGTQKFLLPVRAENIACQRSTTICSKNVIEFRDYHKFSGESTIEFK